MFMKWGSLELFENYKSIIVLFLQRSFLGFTLSIMIYQKPSTFITESEGTSGKVRFGVLFSVRNGRRLGDYII